MGEWNRGEIIGLITLIVGILACIANWIVVPGFQNKLNNRSFFAYAILFIAILAFFASWIMFPEFRNMFNNRGFFVYSIPYIVGFSLIGFLISTIVWHYQKHLSLQDDNPKDNPVTIERPSVEPSINAVGTQLIYAGPDKIIIWTTIKLIDKFGKERYLSNLTANNFTVSESFSGESHKAPIVEVKSSNVPVKAILLIDKSGSMAESSGVDKSTKMKVAKDAARFFFNQLTVLDDNLIAILPFSGNKVEVKNENGGIWLNNKSKKLLEISLKRLGAGGKTPLWQSINNSLEQFSNINEESYKVIICLTDGMNNVDSVSFETLLNNAKEKQIPIFTVGYGGAGKLNSDELARLSKDSGAGKEDVGSFMQVQPKDWSSRLTSIGTGISNLYEIYWNPTGTVSGTQVTVQIDINYELDGESLKTTERRKYILP